MSDDPGARTATTRALSSHVRARRVIIIGASRLDLRPIV